MKKSKFGIPIINPYNIKNYRRGNSININNSIQKFTLRYKSRREMYRERIIGNRLFGIHVYKIWQI
jgi:hypothetical protein